MSAQNPVAELPLFATTSREGVGASVRHDLIPEMAGVPMTPVEHGRAGSDDAAKHLTDHMPGWLLEKLGDALLSMRGREFTSDDVRAAAGPAVDAWLTAQPVRVNCLSGWFQEACRRHHLVRVGSTVSKRPEARGRWLGVWRFPETR